MASMRSSSRPENKDITVVDRAHFNTTDVSVAAQIEHIKAANPQVLIAWSTGTPIATVFKGIVQAGLDIPIATTNGNMTYAQMTQYACVPAEAALHRRARMGAASGRDHARSGR